MADETNGAAGAPEQAGGEAAINALFDAPQEQAPEGESVQVAGTTEAQPTADADDTWTAGYVPKTFRGEDGTFNGNQDAVFKSWMDGRQRISGLEAELAALKTGQAIPETNDEYLDTMDFDALQQRAPNAYAGGGKDNPVVADLLRLGHKHRVPVKTMQALVGDYFEGINQHVPAPQTEDEARKAAVGYLGPNGPQMMQDIQGFLAAEARRDPFPEKHVARIKGMLMDGPSAAVLHRLARRAASTAPPGAGTSTPPDPAAEKREARAMLGVSDEEWRRTKAAAVARNYAANPEWGA